MSCPKSAASPFSYEALWFSDIQLAERADCNQNDGSILEKKKKKITLRHDARESPHYFSDLTSELSRGLLFEGFPILHANVLTNACKSFMTAEHRRLVARLRTRLCSSHRSLVQPIYFHHRRNE